MNKLNIFQTIIHRHVANAYNAIASHTGTRTCNSTLKTTHFLRFFVFTYVFRSFCFCNVCHRNMVSRRYKSNNNDEIKMKKARTHEKKKINKIKQSMWNLHNFLYTEESIYERHPPKHTQAISWNMFSVTKEIRLVWWLFFYFFVCFLSKRIHWTPNFERNTLE